MLTIDELIDKLCKTGVLSISQLSRLSGFKVPRKYEHIKLKSVFKMHVLEDYREVEVDFEPHRKELKSSIAEFKSLYFKNKESKETDLLGFELFVQWLYRFLPNDISSLDYFVGRVYNKDSDEVEKILNGYELEYQDFRVFIKKYRAKVLKYLGADRDVVIPAKFDGARVTAISDSAFSGNENLIAIKLPKSIDRIGDNAFSNCQSLAAIDFSLNDEATISYEGGMRHIGASAFKGCKSLREIEIQDSVTFIGEEAFCGCVSLSNFSFPAKATVVGKGLFKDCLSLSGDVLHNNVVEIRDKAFLGCPNLKVVKMPDNVTYIADTAFDKNIVIVCEENSYTHNFAKKNELKVRLIPVELEKKDTHLVPYESGDIFDFKGHKSFYDESYLDEALLRYELREIRVDYDKKTYEPTYESVEASRYRYDNGTYVKKGEGEINQATIMMTGDIICRRLQQEAAYQNGKYNFCDMFMYIKDTLGQADFVVGNLEMLVSKSFPYTIEKDRIANRYSFNVSEALLGALRESGFDAVTNAQNHIYDAGTKAIFETVDAMNKFQLIHSGVFAHKDEKKYLMVNINGIKVAFLSYFDVARTRNKRINYRDAGTEAMFNNFGRELGVQQVKRDVEGAKADGAEFIICFAHWGKEWTNNTLKSQRELAQDVANCGVDYIFGAHPHCVQRHTILKARDGREVPCHFSAGNLTTDIYYRQSKVRDTYIGELRLSKDESAKVSVVSDKYYPCHTIKIDHLEKPFYTVVPAAIDLDRLYKRKRRYNKGLEDAAERIDRDIKSDIPKELPKGDQALIRPSYLLRDMIDPKGKTIRVIGKSPIMSLATICELINISVPNKYEKDAKKDIIETKAFKQIKEHKYLLSQMCEVKSHKEDYYRLLINALNAFENSYSDTVNIKKGDERKLFYFIDWFYRLRSLNFIAFDYFRNRLYLKNSETAKGFLSHNDRMYLFNKYVEKDKRKFFSNKKLFNQTFKDYIGRDFVDAATCKYEEFEEFIAKNPRFFAKPVSGMKGYGARIIEVNEKSDIFKIYEECKGNGDLCEELVIQHEELARLNSSTLNTLRVRTFVESDGKAVITNVGLRVGRKGETVDSINMGGLIAEIDIRTGVGITNFIDLKGRASRRHPDSGVLIKGFKVPHFERVKEVVIEAAKVVDGVRHVGWDIAVTDKGDVELIEGNCHPGLARTQIASHRGKRYAYEDYLPKHKSLKQIATTAKKHI